MTFLNPRSILFQLPLRGEEETQDLLVAARGRQNSQGAEVSDSFAKGVASMHSIQLAGALLVKDDGKDVRIPLPSAPFHQASLTIKDGVRILSHKREAPSEAKVMHLWTTDTLRVEGDTLKVEGADETSERRGG